MIFIVAGARHWMEAGVEDKGGAMVAGRLPGKLPFGSEVEGEVGRADEGAEGGAEEDDAASMVGEGAEMVAEEAEGVQARGDAVGGDDSGGGVGTWVGG